MSTPGREPQPGRQDRSSPVRLIEIDETADGQRIDNFLIRELKGVPRTRIYRMLRTGEVRINKGRARPDRRLACGDLVRLPPVRQAAERPPFEIKKNKDRLLKTIVYEDKLMYIIDKPAGLAVHGGSGLSYGVIEALRAARPQERQLELAHRLDRDTSGCLMIARRRSGLRRLQELQRAGGIEKHYLALLAGVVERRRFSIDAPLRKNRLQGGERIVRVDADGQRAVSHFEVVRRYDDATLVRVRLETGRTHQIRVHAAHAGHPILGDDRYGRKEHNRDWRRRGLKRLFLHAAELRLPWGDPPVPLKVSCPLPDELDQALERSRSR